LGCGNFDDGSQFILALMYSMPGKCQQCGSKTYLGRTIIRKDSMEIQNIPCTICYECGHEQIGQQTQKKIDNLLERAGKGKLKVRLVVM
jgi:hypothetical protein